MASKKASKLENMIGRKVVCKTIVDFRWSDTVTFPSQNLGHISPNWEGTITDGLRWRCSVPSYQAYTVRFDDADGKPVVWAFLKPDEIEAV